MAEPPRGAEPLWRTPPGRLAPPHVYRMASALGAELRRLSGRFGPDAVAGLVPPVVRLLELLEALVGASTGVSPGSWELLTAIPLGLGADSTARKEREVMLRLKEVVDKQRDEIRAQAHEIVCKSRDTEALQEQLQRFMSMNEDLRHKVAVVQAQLKSALEKKSDLEAVEGAPLPDEEPQPRDASRSPAHCCFSKEELQQILQEISLVNYRILFSRELLNEDRVPSFFLNAMKSTIKRQKRKIRAKMLGTAEESGEQVSPAGPRTGEVSGAGWLPAGSVPPCAVTPCEGTPQAPALQPSLGDSPPSPAGPAWSPSVSPRSSWHSPWVCWGLCRAGDIPPAVAAGPLSAVPGFVACKLVRGLRLCCPGNVGPASADQAPRVWS
uniref:Rab interacting lysosomal protein n=1 Tax=Anas platyrhynchos TaxID=8839 RepID=A0A8B9R8K6_ANAPL